MTKNYDDKKKILEEVNKLKSEKAESQRKANKEFLMNRFGFNEEQCEKIVSAKNFTPLSQNELSKRIKFFSSLGLSKKEIGKIAIKFGKIFSYSTEHMEKVCKTLRKKVGIEEKDIVTIVTGYPRVFSHKVDQIGKKIKDIEKILCPEEKSGKELVRKNLSILFKNPEEIKKKKEAIAKTFDLTEDEVRKVIFSNPNICNMDAKEFERKAKAIEEVYGSKKAIMLSNRLITATPGKLKFNYALFAGLSNDTSFMAKNFFVISPQLAYARAMALYNEGRKTSVTTVMYSEKEFEKKVGLTKGQILKEYPLTEKEVKGVFENYNQNHPAKELKLSKEELSDFLYSEKNKKSKITNKKSNEMGG